MWLRDDIIDPFTENLLSNYRGTYGKPLQNDQPVKRIRAHLLLTEDSRGNIERGNILVKYFFQKLKYRLSMLT